MNLSDGLDNKVVQKSKRLYRRGERAKRKVDRLQTATQELQETLNLPLRKCNAELHVK